MTRTVTYYLPSDRTVLGKILPLVSRTLPGFDAEFRAPEVLIDSGRVSRTRLCVGSSLMDCSLRVAEPFMSEGESMDDASCRLRLLDEARPPLPVLAKWNLPSNPHAAHAVWRSTALDHFIEYLDLGYVGQAVFTNDHHSGFSRCVLHMDPLTVFGEGMRAGQAILFAEGNAGVLLDAIEAVEALGLEEAVI